MKLLRLLRGQICHVGVRDDGLLYEMRHIEWSFECVPRVSCGLSL